MSPSTTALTPGGRVRLARENLCLAMAVYAASHQGLITATFVPNSAELFLTNGQTFAAGVPLDVSDHRSLLRTAGNQVRGAFSLLAVHTQRELDATLGPLTHAVRPPAESPEANLWGARSIFFVINHSLNDDPMAPSWRVPPAFRHPIAVPALNITLDASNLNGEEIRWGHFGGLPGYLDLALFVSYCLDGIDVATAAQAASGNYGAMGHLAQRYSSEIPSRSPVRNSGGYGSGSGRLRRPAPHARTDDADAPAGWVAPDGLPEPRISVASQASDLGAVDDFITNACSTGTRAMTLAGDLYTAYSRWCLDHGYLAHSQRKFGLELRARGYQRKRRGKGRHWWMGLECRS